MAISSLVGGQSVSHVLQWNTSVSDFSASSNSSWLNVTVWLWLLGHTISNSRRSLMGPPAACESSSIVALLPRAPNEHLDGSASPRPAGGARHTWSSSRGVADHTLRWAAPRELPRPLPSIPFSRRRLGEVCHIAIELHAVEWNNDHFTAMIVVP